MISKHNNWKYDALIPFFVGDRRYGQDMIRDFYSTISHIGAVIEGQAGAATSRLRGGHISQGSSFSEIDITELFAIINSSVEIPDSFASIPPTKTTADITIPTYLAAQTDISLSGATLDGAATNYVKASYVVVDGNTRQRVKKAGTYSYEVQPSILITVNTTAPTVYELELATLVGDGSSFLTITETIYGGVISSNVALKTKIVEIGDWDMVATASVSITHGIAGGLTKIRSVDVEIINDTEQFSYPLDYNGPLGISGYSRNSLTTISLTRVASGTFDSASFDLTSFNRGWITITYES